MRARTASLLVASAGLVACASLAGLDGYGEGVTTGGGGVTSAGGADTGGGTGGIEDGDGGQGGVGGETQPASYAEVVASDTPLGHWPFDTLVGDQLPDVAGMDQSLTAVMPFEPTDGLFQDSLGAFRMLDGGMEPNGHALRDASGLFAFPMQAKFTLEIWLSIEQPVMDATVLGRSGLSQAEYQGYRLIVDFNELRFQRYASNSNVHQAVVPDLMNGRPYHVMARYDSECMCVFVIDGLDGTQRGDCRSSTLANPATNPPLRVGNNNGFVGVVDEAAVYGDALSTDQMLAHYEAATGQTLRDEFPGCP